MFFTSPEPPAPRISYELGSRYPSEEQKATIGRFHEELEAYLEEDAVICVSEPGTLAS